MLEVEDTTKRDRLYHFVSGLQPWAHAEFHRREIKTLQAAMETAMTFIDEGVDHKPAVLGAGSSKSPLPEGE